MQTQKHDGAFRPSEVALLAGVLEKLKVKDLAQAEREAVAKRVLANFMAGVTDEAGLISLSQKPLGR